MVFILQSRKRDSTEFRCEGHNEKIFFFKLLVEICKVTWKVEVPNTDWFEKDLDNYIALKLFHNLSLSDIPSFSWSSVDIV